MSVEPLALFKSLADGSRLQIVRGLMQQPMYVELIAQRTGLSPSTVSFHLKKLESAGVVEAEKEQYYVVYRLNRELLGRSLEDLLAVCTEGEEEATQREAAYRQKVLDAFLVHGKLCSIPVQRKKKRIILEEIAMRFETGRTYSEREVNLLIADIYDDFCTIRRDLISEKLMERKNGIYWVIEKPDPVE